MFFNWNQKSCVADYSALSSRLFFYNFVKFQNSLSAPMYTVPNSLLLLNVQLPFLTVCIFMLLPPAEVAGKIPHYTVLYRICACHHCTLPSTVYSRSCLSFPFKKMLLVNITTGSDCCLWLPSLDPTAVFEYHHWIQLLFVNTTTGSN